MLRFCKLQENEFDKFSKKHKNKCFFQSTSVAKLRELSGWNSHYLGVKDDDTLVAATLLISRKRHFKYEFYAIRGPLVDFENVELVNFFVKNLKKYVKENKGYLLKIDPYVEARSLDKDANPTNLFDNTKYKDTLKKLGFKEVKAKEMLDTTQAKYMYVIDIKNNCTIDDIMKDMDPKTRQMIHKNEKQGIVIRIGDINDLPLFEEIMEKTSERRHFENRGIKFFKNFYECLSKDKIPMLVFAELDIDIALANINKEREEIEKTRKDREKARQLGKCNEKKAQIKEKEEDQMLESLSKREIELKDLKSKHKKRIPLGAILYVIYGNEVASLFGGSYEEYKKYQPFYTIHYEMIKYAVDNNFKRYNFYAINNHLDEKDEQYGVYLFKRSFGGHVIEFIGEFILPTDYLIYYLFKLVKKLKREK